MLLLTWCFSWKVEMAEEWEGLFSQFPIFEPLHQSVISFHINVSSLPLGHLFFDF